MASVAFTARKQKPVTRNPLKEMHLANNIVHNDVNIVDLQKQISDLKEIVSTHVLKNKKEECCNSLLSDSTNNSHNNNTNLYISKNKKSKKRRNSLKNRHRKKERETNEKIPSQSVKPSSY